MNILSIAHSECGNALPLGPKCPYAVSGPRGTWYLRGRASSVPHGGHAALPDAVARGADCGPPRQTRSVPAAPARNGDHQAAGHDDAAHRGVDGALVRAVETAGGVGAGRRHGCVAESHCALEQEAIACRGPHDGAGPV